MVEVFRTNVQHPDHAILIVREIETKFREYRANFDLEDCDRILRISSAGSINAALVISLLNSLGFDSAILPDEIPALSEFTM